MVIQPGMLARSKAGRDKGHVYFVTGADEKYVFVADGAKKPLCRTKRKNRKHLQPILKACFKGTPDDAAVREAIEKYGAACRQDGGL